MMNLVFPCPPSGSAGDPIFVPCGPHTVPAGRGLFGPCDSVVAGTEAGHQTKASYTAVCKLIGTMVRRCTKNARVAVLQDGLPAHATELSEQVLSEKDIEMFTLAPGTTQDVQPLDRTIFAVVKRLVPEEVEVGGPLRRMDASLLLR